jgi:hypothetical protein
MFSFCILIYLDLDIVLQDSLIGMQYLTMAN